MISVNTQESAVYYWIPYSVDVDESTNADP